MTHVINTKDLRTQFAEQVKCLDAKRAVDSVLIEDLQDFFRKRAVVEQSYSESLSKLVGSLKQRYVNETNRDSQNPHYSTNLIWHTLLGSTLRISEAHATLSDLLGKQMIQRLSDIEEDSARLHKQCRDMMNTFQQTVLADINKLQTDLREYAATHLAAVEADRQRRRADDKVVVASQKARAKGKDPSTSERVLRAQNEYASKDLSFTSASLITTRARNNFLLQLAATNCGVTRYFADEAPDVIDCLSCGFHNSLARSVMMYLSCEESLKTCHGSIVEMLNRNITALDWQEDKMQFLKSNAQSFTRPHAFLFTPMKEDTETEIRSDAVLREQLEANLAQLTEEIEKVRASSESLWNALEKSEKKLLELINQKDYDVSSLFITTPVKRHRTAGQLPNLPSVSSAISSSVNSVASIVASQSGVQPPPPTTSAVDAPSGDIHPVRSHSVNMTESTSLVGLYSELRTLYRDNRIEEEKFYLDCFTHYTEEIHKCHVLQAKASEIRKALNSESNSVFTALKLGHQVLPTSSESIRSPKHATQISPLSKSSGIFNYPSPPPPCKAPPSCGGQASDGNKSTTVIPHTGRRVLRVPNVGKPKLFGGTIDEYVAATNDPIPPVPLSCMRAIVRHGMHQRGIFRVSSIQTEIEQYKTAFEHGEDPLRNSTSPKDVHLACSLLKLYFRKLSEPPFPATIFYSLIECTQTNTDSDEPARLVRPIIIRYLSRPVFIVMRFLFAFLNHVTSHSDENSMDAHNLAVCFAPSLMPVPSDRSQVHFQNTVIGLVSTFITHHQLIFDPLIPGPVYVKVEVAEDDHNTIPDIVATVPSFLITDDQTEGNVTLSPTAIANSMKPIVRRPNFRDSTTSIGTKSSSLNDLLDVDQPAVRAVGNALGKESDNSCDDLRSISDSDVSELPCTVALAQADFIGASERELSFSQGDELLLYRRLNEHWWEGQLCSDRKGTRGLVPHSYLILKPPLAVQSDDDIIDENHLSNQHCDITSTDDSSHAAVTRDEDSKPVPVCSSAAKVTLPPESGITSTPIPKLQTKVVMSSLPKVSFSNEASGRVNIEHPQSELIEQSSRRSQVTNGISEKSLATERDSVSLHPATSAETNAQLPVKSNSEATSPSQNSDIDNQLAEVMRNLNRLERADTRSVEYHSTERYRELRRKLQMPCAKHAPDLVMDLPYSVPVSKASAYKSAGSQYSVHSSSADNFAVQGQDTMKKRPEAAPVESPPYASKKLDVQLSKTSPPQSFDLAQTTSPSAADQTSEAEVARPSIAARVAAFEVTSQSRGLGKPNLAPKPRKV